MNLAESGDFVLINQARLAEQFYGRLFSEHPEMQPFFEGVDLAHQQEKLATALSTIVRQETVGGWVSENYLHGLGKMHLTMRVGRELFPRFIDTLMKSLAELHEADWTMRLEDDWRAALNKSLKLMLSEYDAADSESQS